jgi:hypothetical protein
MVEFSVRARCAALFAWLGACSVLMGCGPSSDAALGDAGTLREDSAVLLKTSDDSYAAAVMDAVRDGDDVYVIVNVGYQPVLLASHDAGRTWTNHPLPASYDKVEGVEDQVPGFYQLYPWQGRLYMLVSAVTVTQRVSYLAVAEVNLQTNDYSMKSTHLHSGRIHFENGVALVAKTEGNGPTDGGLAYGNVYWQRYDFASDMMLPGNTVQLAGTGLGPTNWASVDGQQLVALSSRAPANAPVELCRVVLDTATGGTTLQPYCLSRLRVPLADAEKTHPFTTGQDVGWLSDLAGHGFLTELEVSGDSVKPHARDLGPGTLADQNFNGAHRRFGDFLVLTQSGEDAMTTQPRPRLVGFAANGDVQDVELPWTPCDGGETCGYGRAGVYGTVRWILPMDDGEQLVFHIVGQTSTGLPQLLVMTREHAKLSAPTFTPVDLGALPGRPGLRPAPKSVQQCVRAVSCGYHVNLPGCQQYWSTVRRGPDGSDELFAAFLAAPPGGCEILQEAYTDVQNPKNPKPCAPGCDGDWATFACNGPVRLNCAARGVPCRVDTMGHGYCADRDLTPANCNSCDGDMAINCADSPMPSMTDCSLNHLKCQLLVEAPNPSRAVCSPGACPTSGAASCIGEVDTACWPGNPVITHELDCSRMLETSKCSDPGPCVVYSESQLCEDGLLIYGNGEASRFVDCKAIGFAGCVAKPDGAPGLYQVSCVP